MKPWPRGVMSRTPVTGSPVLVLVVVARRRPRRAAAAAVASPRRRARGGRRGSVAAVCGRGRARLAVARPRAAPGRARGRSRRGCARGSPRRAPRAGACGSARRRARRRGRAGRRGVRCRGLAIGRGGYRRALRRRTRRPARRSARRRIGALGLELGRPRLGLGPHPRLVPAELARRSPRRPAAPTSASRSSRCGDEREARAAQQHVADAARLLVASGDHRLGEQVGLARDDRPAELGALGRDREHDLRAAWP